jgi:hypothetical protein
MKKIKRNYKKDMMLLAGCLSEKESEEMKQEIKISKKSGKIDLLKMGFSNFLIYVF